MRQAEALAGHRVTGSLLTDGALGVAAAGWGRKQKRCWGITRSSTQTLGVQEKMGSPQG